MTDVSGNSEEERASEFYNQTWTEEAVHRYFYRQVMWLGFTYFLIEMFVWKVHENLD